MKVEIGGGRYPRGDGFVNVDMIPEADIVCDLDETPWPIDSGSATAVYSSHCLEHLVNPIDALKEITRICQPGSPVVIRVPDFNSEGMFTSQHRSCVSEVFMQNILVHFASDNFPVDGKRLAQEAVEKKPCPVHFERAKASRLFRGWTDLEIMTWIPRTCHENEFHLRVVAAL